MGIGVRVGTSFKSGGLPRRSSSRQVLDDVWTAICDDLADPLLNELVHGEPEGDTLYVRLHPAEEAAEFSVGEGGLLICSAKTSSAGPGYHAALVELLDRLEERCGLAWEWNNEARQFSDETGFQQHRDFQDLQAEMTSLLRRIAQVVLEEEHEYANLALSLPAGFIVSGDYFAVSSMGYWNREWFESVASAEPAQLAARGAEFFPWWNRKRDAFFWRNWGLVKAWVDLPWRPPATEEEANEYALVLDCFRRASDMDPKVELPEIEIAEIESLLDAQDGPCREPAPDRVGFRRRALRRFASGGWQIDVPGYFFEDLEDDETTVVYWYGTKTIRLSSITVRGKNDEDVPPESLLAPEPDPVPAEVELFRFAKPGLLGLAELCWHEEDDACWMLQGRVATENNLCFVTICYENPTDKPWALETWRSVLHPIDQNPA